MNRAILKHAIYCFLVFYVFNISERSARAEMKFYYGLPKLVYSIGKGIDPTTEKELELLEKFESLEFVAEAYYIERDLLNKLLLPYMQQKLGYEEGFPHELEFRFVSEELLEDEEDYSYGFMQTVDIYRVKYELLYNGIKINDSKIKLDFVDGVLKSFDLHYGIPDPVPSVQIPESQALEQGIKQANQQNRKNNMSFKYADLTDEVTEPNPLEKVFVYNKHQKKWHLTYAFYIDEVNHPPERKKSWTMFVDTADCKLLFMKLLKRPGGPPPPWL